MTMPVLKTTVNVQHCINMHCIPVTQVGGLLPTFSDGSGFPVAEGADLLGGANLRHRHF